MKDINSYIVEKFKISKDIHSEHEIYSISFVKAYRINEKIKDSKALKKELLKRTKLEVSDIDVEVEDRHLKEVTYTIEVDKDIDKLLLVLMYIFDKIDVGNDYIDKYDKWFSKYLIDYDTNWKSFIENDITYEKLEKAWSKYLDIKEKK